jgi:tRNA pseudouridine55 synthase
MDEQDLFKALINVDKPLEALPLVYLSDEQAIAIKYGQSISFPRSSGSGPDLEQDMIRMYHSDVFLGLGEMLMDGKITPKKLFNMSNSIET